MYNVYPHTTIPAELALRSSALRVNQRTRINNESIWKESTTMHSSLFALDAQVQAATNKRLEQALTAKQLRAASARRDNAFSSLVMTVRRATGETLIAVGTWLRRETEKDAARKTGSRAATRSSTATT